MNRRDILSLLTFVCMAPVAAKASGGGEKPAGESIIRMPQVGVPVVKGNKVVNYIFISMKVILSLKANQVALQEREPYFRDALIRTAHTTDMCVDGRNDQLDPAKFKKALMPVFAKLAGAGMITDIVIVSQTPKKHQRG